MNIQVLGEKGILGHAVSRKVLERGHSLVRARRATPIDIRHVMPAAIRGEVVINCAGLVKQRPRHDSDFIQTNSYGPHWLAEVCDSVDARMIHISTDCVFSHPGPHDEDDYTSGKDIYALSKRAGEVTREPHLTVRTSFVGFGTHGLIHDILSKREIKASRALLWSGHTAETVADLLVILAERPDVTGLLHIPGEFQSRFDVVRTLAAWLERDIRIIEQDDFIHDRRLISKRWESLGLPQIPLFRDQIARMELA